MTAAVGQIGKTNRNVFRFISLSRDGLQFTVVTDFDPGLSMSQSQQVHERIFALS